MEVKLDVHTELICCLVALELAYSAPMEITCAYSLQVLPGDQKRDIHLTLHAELECIAATKLHYATSRLLYPRHDYQASLCFTAPGD